MTHAEDTGKPRTHPLDWLGNERLKENLLLKGFALTKIPMLLYLGARVRAISSDACEIDVPLTWRSRNHVGSMYFAALCAGADLACGLLAMRVARVVAPDVVLIFKELGARFVRRADGDVTFVCASGPEIRACVEQAARTGERHEVRVPVEAVVHRPQGPRGAARASATPETVARFELVMSMKKARAKG